MSNTRSADAIEGIAIVGMAGRFPRARNIAEFWRTLRDGVEAISFFSDEELLDAGIEPAKLHAPNYVKAKGVLEDCELFDASFFGFTPREAEIMDPQHRIFLECAWEALESAGYDPETYAGAIGVYAGESMNTYLMFNLLSNRDFLESVGVQQTSIQNRTDHLTTRVAYELNLKGPAVTVQSACSTSLVAVHLACQSLLNGECDLALAGGASVTVPKKNGYFYQEGGILSPDGHCKAFDAAARGTVDGDGAAVVLLKRVEDAIADGDFIRAVIRGSAINNDGSLKMGFTTPSVNGQAEVIAEAQAMAGVETESVTYVETHGTGTVLGDPIEIEALTQAFRQNTERKNYCAIGSVKTNIGHLDAAAGVAGLIKTVLALEHEQLPPSLHYEQPNPSIDFAGSPFYVNAALSEWKRGDAARRAGVSSFGIGGTNAHVVVEEAPVLEVSESSRPWHVLPISAKTSTALNAATLNLIDHLKQNPDLNLADVAYTLQLGRRAFAHRRVVVARDIEGVVNSLESLDHRRVFNGLREPKEWPVVFMLTGQGAQYVDMGAELYAVEPEFRREVDRCAELLKPELGLDLRQVLYPQEGESQRAAERLKQTFITQPALFVIEYALAKLWMKRGVRPAAMIGHSIGEYVAACLAGVMTLEEALRLVAARGRLMQGLPGGAMLVVPLPEKEVEALLNGRSIALAAVNAPSLCVVSGETEAVDVLERELTGKGLVCRRLHTSHAFHSQMMEPILDSFIEEVKKVKLNAPAIPYISNVSGTWITAAEATDPAYWARHLRQTVRFDDGLNELFKDPDRIMLEVGPGRTLSTLVRQHPYKGAGRVVLSSLPHADERDSDVAFLLATEGRLWLSGIKVDWSQLYVGEQRRRVPLPTYPFERQKYWIEPQAQATLAGADGRRSALRKNPNIADWFYVPSWKRTTAPAAASIPAEPKSWIIFEDECGLGAEMAKRLEDINQDFVSVRAGESFAETGERAYLINPAEREDYERLFKDLRASGRTQLSIVHLWNVTDREKETQARAEDRRFEQTGFYSPLFLAQALAGANFTEQLQIFIVSSDMQEVTGEERLNPEKALLLGACRVIPQEFENILCRSVDVVVPARASAQRERLVEQLIAEATLEESGAVIAYRGHHRWAQVFEPSPLNTANGRSPRLRDGGVYLITGGLGGMALELAEHLAQTVRARLVLVGRTALPPEGEWDEWLGAHDEQDASSRKIRKVQALKSAGAEVLILSADVTNEEQMRDALSRARERFGEIHGVVHTAGVAGGGVIPLKTPEMAARVLAPKVEGTRVLEALFADAPLDFMLLCSSRSAILGGFGQIDYCAANAYLDAFSHYHAARRGTYTVSINWDAWQSVGMLVNTATQFGTKPTTTPAAPNGNGAQPVHPLLDRCLDDNPEQATYATEFTAKHWVLDDHRIVGAAIMPGTAYLEMARAAVEKEMENRAVEIEDAFFLAPLALRDDEKREVRLVVDKEDDGFAFRVLSKPPAENGEQTDWQNYSVGRIVPTEPATPQKHDLQAILERCSVREVVIRDDDEFDPDLGPRWQSLQRVHMGDNELLAVLELPEEFAADLSQYKLHPALLDRATGTAKHYLTSGGHYLPMSYKRLRMLAPLPRKIYTYIKYKENKESQKETITFDIVLMDKDGVEKVVIEEFSQKRVNDTASPIRAMSGKKASAAKQGAAESSGAEATNSDLYQRSLSEGIAPQEGREVFARVLAANLGAQVVVSTKDLQAAIEQSRSVAQSRVVEEVEKLQVSRPAHPRPNVQTAYAAPTDEVEATLAEILQAVLGIEQVGIHDNFFELGGDSVLGIQIIAKANRAGLQLTPQQIFQHQTVAELAKVAGRTQLVEAEQGLVTGSVPLTPIQSWFFEGDVPEPQHWNQSIMLAARQPLDVARLETAIRQLFVQHDALRLRFTKDGAGWQQSNAEKEDSDVFRRVDMSGVAEAEQPSFVEATGAALQTSLNLSEGPIARFAYFDAGAGRAGRLLILVHQLAADDFSWQILLEDLETAYRQLAGGQNIKLPRKTTSFKRWAERLEEHARSAALKEEAAFWLDERHARARRLPVDIAGSNTESSVQSVSVSLGEEETRLLSQEVPQTYHAQISDVLLTAMAQTLVGWTGDESVLMSLEGPGRETLFEGIDLSRTVAWCTELFPVLVQLRAKENPGECLKSVKEQLRQVPNWGVGYGLLRYLGDDEAVRAKLRSFPQSEVFVSFKSPSSIDRSATTLFAPATETAGAPRHGSALRPHLLEINVFDAGGTLQAVWKYSRNLHRPETIERLAQSFVESLRELIVHCQSPEAGGFTPSDFPLAGLTEGKLQKLSMLLAESDELSESVELN